ncbi:MAG: bifunctional 23S rRNA (guanine(2069)-N(7))-methyltransferase RlmK/23S rRNA (guanine(2445)-N(2))-methyltransferase RlmL, partial [Planctomycetota bacterium]
WISQAPLKETLAAALIQLSFWKPDRRLVDPFCGGGTIPIEAARMARNMAPGVDRDFAFESWEQTDLAIVAKVRQQARDAVLPSVPVRLIGSDHDAKVLRAARKNAVAAGVGEDIEFECRPFDQLGSKRRFGCIITNPPYGERIGDGVDLDALYGSIPDVLRELPTWSFYFFSAYRPFEKTIGRPADRRRKLYNGRIECTYYQFHGPRPVRENRMTPPITTESEPESKTETPPAINGNADEGSDDDVALHNENEASNPTAQVTDSKSTDSTSTESPSADSSNDEQQLVHAVGKAVFGHMDENTRRQADLFAARLRKRARHLRRWPTRRGITCFRLYEKDVPEIPLCVDRYEDHLHITEFERPHTRTPEEHQSWLEEMKRVAAKTLEVDLRNTFLKQRGRQKRHSQHERIDHTGNRLQVSEGGLKFWVNLQDYIDTGLFLDHRVTRDMVRREAKNADVLNLFAYTCSFGLYAADGGAASTTNIDLSNRYLDWGADNYHLNYLEPADRRFRFLAADIPTWVADQEPRPQYDLVILDPPTYSRSKRTESDWNVQKDAVPLLQSIIPLVRPGGVIYFSTNFRTFKFESSVLPVENVREISRQTVPEDFRNQRIHRCWRIELDS